MQMDVHSAGTPPLKSLVKEWQAQLEDQADG